MSNTKRLFEALTTTLNSKGISFKDLKLVTNYSGHKTTSYFIRASIFREDHNIWITISSDDGKSHSEVFESFFNEVKKWSSIEIIIHKTININLLDDSEKSNQIIINKLQSKNEEFEKTIIYSTKNSKK